MDDEESIQQEAVDAFGKPLVEWEVDEYDNHSRSRFWYITASIVGVGLIVYSVLTANFLFAVIILMGGIITLLASFQEPETINVFILPTGVVIGDDYYEYKYMKDFSIVYDPPEIKMLYVDFESAFEPMLAVPIEDVNPNTVRDSLLPYCIENLERTEERLTDTVRRLYKL